MSTDKKHTFVLVHGAWHGAWCWEKIVPLLSASGHQVHTLDLPGLGEDKTPISEVSLDSYVTKVSDLIISLAKPVVLVGHSMGGMVITQVAEKIPDRIDTLIYLTAFSPKHGETLLQYALQDESDVAKYKQVFEDEGYFIVPDDKIQKCFYDLCSQEDVDKAMQRLRPQALAPIATPLRLSEENYGTVRRCYIKCSQDRAITPQMQDILCANARLDSSLTLNTDHSPFYSCPQDLVEAFISLAQ
ncbi:MAG: alpha/beta fold hydrolase [Gammaproteobacteria bacterium]|nr:alpha/beta fold hydrolase [Gammaproteobacteria bacterium]